MIVVHGESNMSDMYLLHSAKGSEWKDHKYIRKEGNRYVYEDDNTKDNDFEYTKQIEMQKLLIELNKHLGSLDAWSRLGKEYIEEGKLDNKTLHQMQAFARQDREAARKKLDEIHEIEKNVQRSKRRYKPVQ